MDAPWFVFALFKIVSWTRVVKDHTWPLWVLIRRLSLMQHMLCSRLVRAPKPDWLLVQAIAADVARRGECVNRATQILMELKVSN